MYHISTQRHECASFPLHFVRSRALPGIGQRCSGCLVLPEGCGSCVWKCCGVFCCSAEEVVWCGEQRDVAVHQSVVRKHPPLFVGDGNVPPLSK